MSTPTGTPTLSAGAHAPDEGRACVMEYVALLAGEPWTDSPTCTHPVLARMAQVVNDRLPDDRRHELVPLIGRLFGTGEAGTEHERRVLSVQLAVWCGRQALPLVREGDRAVCVKALDTAEAWTRGEATEQECAYAANAADAAYAAYAAYAASAATAAAYAASAATAATAAAYAASAANAANAADAAASAAIHAAYAATAAAYAANAASAAIHAAYTAAAAAYAANAADAAAYAAYADLADPADLLTGLLDEYDRLTGRAEHRDVTPADLADLAAVVGA